MLGRGMEERGKERRGGSRRPEHERGYIRLAGLLVGLISLFVPWGSIIVRDETHATISITSVWMIDLVASFSVVVAITSIIFISATVLALLDGRAVIGQIAALAILFVTVPGLLWDMVAALGPTLPEGSVSTTIAAGFYLGVFSVIVLLVSFVPFKEVDHEVDTGLIGTERLRPEENPYHRWKDRPGPP